MLAAVRLRNPIQIAVALLLLVSCMDDNSVAKDKMPKPSKARPEGFADVDTGARPQLKESPEPTVGDAGPAPRKNARPALTEAEVKALGLTLPKFEGELVLKALSPIAHSRVATMTICISKPLTAATSQVVREYRKKSWESIRVTTPPNDKKRRRLSANAERYRMTATAQGGATIGCSSPETHTKISMRFQQRIPTPVNKPAYKLDTPLPKKRALPRRDPDAVRRAPSSESPPQVPQD